ncbi:Riboflavin biosynthesis protein RibBA [Austwickia sp. TVS 96-490-7B]|uniref:3,4-dihydroxy-2-butanone-4-phosphate synthase n=1 Tax=Austwickia sp. TVS 96-490-7B TaxID=2830843 RepID=UPI001C5846B5|nr:3,4-dihydroxy-2-butanone-4-phosphate synthase [Austwickia sp. TVS 96-490-7B]MBW3086054.1 Riboflavin biosynthesis protein RibBA [Austwickia sp. TVS 96-490-7B]
MNDFATIEAALEALQSGRPVLVLDDADRENEGDVVLAAQTASTSWVAWTIRHTSGYLCAPMTAERADALALPPMVATNQDPRGTAYTITCDAARGVTTGISAADRAHTIRVLADPASGPQDVIRPGHVVPLRARPGGVLERAGHTEAAVDLARLAGLTPVGAIGELVHDDGSMMRTDAVLALGAAHDLPVVTIAELARWRRCHDPVVVVPQAPERVSRGAETVLPTAYGDFQAIGYHDRVTGAELIALVSPHGVGEVATVRVHSECLTGDAFGSLRCDCGPQLQAALAQVAGEPGVVVYVQGHEGRGVGLLAKLAAYRLQDGGVDTVDAQVKLGLPVDNREYGGAAAVLADLGVRTLSLLTNNPAKVDALRSAGLDVVARRALTIESNPRNAGYLATKRDRMGHLLMDAGAPVLSVKEG